MKILIYFSLIFGGIIMQANAKTATFAGGCFWCMEPPFEQKLGVTKVEPGYMGGISKNPTYEDVSSGGTGHAEVVQITFDEQLVSYRELLEIFFKNHNPTDGGGQFVDRGDQYRSAIFYHDDSQKSIAESYISQLDKKKLFKDKIATALEKGGQFTMAEDYHRDYYKKNPLRYKFYRYRSGRDQFLNDQWRADKEKQSKINTRDPYAQQKKNLTPLQYSVTQKNGTESSFNNLYWNEKRQGIYVDIISGEPLFSSKDKFKSGTGWPSFSDTISPNNIIKKEDSTLFMNRVELKSKKAGSHLGHLFNDGPAPTNLRYCINSASLRFIPKEKLEQEGYAQYLKQFK